MVIDRRVAEVVLIRRQEDSIPLGCCREDVRVSRTHAEFLDIDYTKYIVACAPPNINIRLAKTGCRLIHPHLRVSGL